MGHPQPDPNAWDDEFPYAVTVCDTRGIITEMNNAAAEHLRDEGGRDLIGSDVLACHPERAQTILKELLATARPNFYSIEKGGQCGAAVQECCRH